MLRKNIKTIIPKLEIFGSYEKSLNESKIIMGHNNTKYVVGGNTRHTTRSNIIEWNLVNETNFGDAQIKAINDILHFPEYITDPDTLYLLLNQINNLRPKKFLQLLENSLNLKESIMIQSRRLFYVIDRVNALQNKKNSLDVNYIRPTEFCPYEPLKRIQILLDVDSGDKHDYTALINTILPFIREFIALIKKKNKLFITTHNVPATQATTQTSFNKVNNEMNKFVQIYTSVYAILHDIETVNVEIAQCFEKICDSFDQFLDKL